MTSIWNAGVYGFISFLIYFVITSIATQVQNSREAHQRGCKEVPHMPKPVWDRLGITEFLGLQRMLKMGKVPQHIKGQFDLMSRRTGKSISTLRITMFGQEPVWTHDPRNIQAILAKQFSDFGFGDARKKTQFPLLGYAIFTQEGKDWEHSRAVLRPAFARHQISDLDVENTHVEHLMKALPSDDDGWTRSTDLQCLFFRLTLDSTTELLFGESINSQLNEINPTDYRSDNAGNAPEEKGQFARAFDTAEYYLAVRGLAGSKYWLFDNKEFRKACKDCRKVTDYYVDLALEYKQKHPDNLTKREGDKYIFLQELTRYTTDRDELRDGLMSILVAGRDTTASLLAYTFYLLATHPEIFQKLRHIILETFGPYKPYSIENITFESLKNCKYLQNVINETLRVLPNVPTNIREAVINTSLPFGGGPDGESPVFVPKGTIVYYSAYALHRSKDLWGPSADLFDPERWYNRKPKWDFVPFGGGQRICLGQQLALTNTAFTITRLLQRFDRIDGLEKSDDTSDVEHKQGLTSCLRNGLWFRLHQADI